MDSERVDGFGILAFAFLLFLGFQIFSDQKVTRPALTMDETDLVNEVAMINLTPGPIDLTGNSGLCT
jgi:hypothetical protein